ncbi:MAG: hypothetical protein WCS80_02970 [Bacilli bacterium]
MITDTTNRPDIGTPEEAKKKMVESYASFLDSAAKFVTLADFYTDPVNEGQTLGTDFRDKYNTNYQKLKVSSVDDFCYSLSFFTLIFLDYIDDVKENLSQYKTILAGQDADLSDYDKACDLLAIRDEFTDLEKVLNDVNLTIADERIAETNYGDPDYDASAKALDARRFD